MGLITERNLKLKTIKTLFINWLTILRCYFGIKMTITQSKTNELAFGSENLEKGFSILFNGSRYTNDYPDNVWQETPFEIKEFLLDNLSVATTMHLGMVYPNVKKIRYSSSRPYFEPYFNQNFIYDIPSCAEVDDNSIPEEIKKFLHLGFEYNNQLVKLPGNNPNDEASRALIGMSFGKDSLLTYAVAEEIGLDPEMIYVVEQSLTYEQKHKTNLANKFYKEFDKQLHILKHDTGKLRDYNYLGLPKSEYGWGLQNTEYALEFIPFAYALKGKYIFFGNEQSTAETYFDDKYNWKVYPCYDQTHEWTVQLNQMTQSITSNTVQTGSLIEPLMDMMIQRILIRRYPQYAKYQMSCFTDNEAGKDYHWCQECTVCAKMYLLSVASGMDPKKIGFTKNMLNKENKHLFTLFGGKSNLPYLNSGLGHTEQLFAFYLASKNSTNGDLLSVFKESSLYQEAKENEEEMRKVFLKIYDSISVPKELIPDIYSIYKEEFNLFEF